MRYVSLVLALSALGAQHAKASFDLMYIPSTTDNMVYRYDPVNRVRLGGFSAPGVRQVFSGNEQFGSLSISAGTYRYNMFNGQNAGFTGFSATSYDHNFGVVNQTTSNVIVTRNLAGGPNVVLPLAGTSLLIRANRFQGGTIASFSASGTNFTGFVHNADGSSIANLGTQTAVGNVTNAIRKFNRDGSESVIIGVWDNGVGALRLLALTRNTIGNFSYSSTTFNSMLLGGSHVSLAPAHNGYYIVGADRTTPTTLTRIYAVDDDGPTGVTYDNWTTNIATGTPSGFTVGMVIAPEPGTMVALGAGVLALLRRRKKS